jgi:hypothetical protein
VRILAIGLLAAILVAMPRPGAVAGAIPDMSPPPGAINPYVTQSNIAQTICRPGWPRTVRAPESYTYQLKRQQMAARHLPGRPRDYQEDHYVPLEIGGHPGDPRNLWPQPLYEANLKDILERALNRAVCGGKMTLAAAQRCLLNQLWTACARRIHTPVP